MQETYSDKHLNNFDDDINLRELFYVLLGGKSIIISLTAFISITAIIFSLSLPNIYESKAILAPVSPSSGMSGAVQSYSSLAGLAGVSLPNVSEGNSQKAIQKIGSLSFFENNIIPNIYLPDLMAVKSWNFKTNTLTFDENIFDTKSNTWIRDYSHPQQQIPTAQESFEVFTTEHLSLSEDKLSGFITLSIKHQSPIVAKKWVELVVNEVNAFYRQKDKLESEKAVSYLNQQISMTGFSEIKEVLAQLLQEETKKLTLIEAKQYYVFEYIDPPAAMEVKSEPKRILICILGALLGGMLSIMLVFARHYAFSKKTP